MKLSFKAGLTFGIFFSMLGIAHAQAVVQKQPKTPMVKKVTARLLMETQWPRPDEVLAMDQLATYRPGVSMTFNHTLDSKSESLASVVRCTDDACVNQVPVTSKNAVMFNAFTLYFDPILESGRYQVTFQAEISDDEGNLLEEDIVWNFTVVPTLPPAGKAPDAPQPAPAPVVPAPVTVEQAPGQPAEPVTGEPGSNDPAIIVEGNAGVPDAVETELADANPAAPAVFMSGAGCSLNAVALSGDFDFLPMALAFGISYFSLARKKR